MKVYEPKDIRNVAILGHAGTGKTTFVEAALLKSGAINRAGTIEDNNTVSDYSDIEHERGNSVFMAPIFCEYKNTKINFIDAPGYDDFVGDAVSALHVCDTGLIFLNAQNGTEVGTEIATSYAAKLNKPMVFAINRLDVEQAKFDDVTQQLKDQYGGSVTVFQYPVNPGPGFNQIIDVFQMKAFTVSADGKVESGDIPAGEKDKAEELRSELIESVAETNEELMNKYFEEGELSVEELSQGLKTAMQSSQIYPIFCLSAKNYIGVVSMMDFIVSAVPSPLDVDIPTEEGSDEVKCDPAGKKALFVYKMFSDQKLGDMTYFRLHSGTLTSGTDMLNETRGSSERFGQLFSTQGKKRVELESVQAGDLAASVKLKNTHINDSLHEKGFNVKFKPIEFPSPKMRIAIQPKTKGEEEKVGMALNAIHQEDPTLLIEHSKELRQTILFSQGELHLNIAKYRLENRYKVEVEFIEPKVPYRETIQKQVRGDYRHKKQSGGAGQFAEVHMMIEPYKEGAPNPEGLNVRGKDLNELDWGGKLEYINCIVGGVIDQRFLPAILKGVMEKMQFGPLTGSYVRDIRVVIYDGKMHPVDSNEAAFKTAGMMVFKSNFQKASPLLLEPIYDVTVKVPEEFVGDVMSDLPSRRGVIQGIESDGHYQIINAKMPLAELDKYSTALRSMTQARATHQSKYSEYQAVPSNIQQELVDAYQKSLEEDE